VLDDPGSQEHPMTSRFAVVFGASLTQFTVIGLLFSFGLFFKVFETEFGWSRTFLSTCSSLSFFMMGMLAMLAGRLSDQYGPRRVLAISGLAYASGYVLMSQVTQPWQLLVVSGTLIGVGLGTHDVVTLSTVARWFEARRGLMTAVVKVGTAAGQIATPPLAAALILWVGWQNALVVLGCGAAVLLLLAALSMRSPPVRTVGPDSPAVTPDPVFGADLRRVLWKLRAIQFLFFPALVTVPLHLPVHGMDLGMSTGKAAAMLSVIGAASVAGRLTVGRVLDLAGGRGGYLLCLSILTLALTGLLLITDHRALFVVVTFYGFAHGALFVVVSPTVADYFGTRAHGAIFGTILFCGTLGASVGPILAGLLFDTTGSYFFAFLTLIFLVVLALALAWSLPPAETATTPPEPQAT
jgi:MFS family permease